MGTDSKVETARPSKRTLNVAKKPQAAGSSFSRVALLTLPILALLAIVLVYFCLCSDCGFILLSSCSPHSTHSRSTSYRSCLLLPLLRLRVHPSLELLSSLYPFSLY